MHVPELNVLSVNDDGLGAAVRAIRTGWTLKKPEEKKNVKKNIKPDILLYQRGIN